MFYNVILIYFKLFSKSALRLSNVRDATVIKIAIMSQLLWSSVGSLRLEKRNFIGRRKKNFETIPIRIRKFVYRLQKNKVRKHFSLMVLTLIK